MGHAGGPDEHWVQVWALAKVRGTCSGGSKSRKLVYNHGVAFRPARANQAYANPKNRAQFLPHVFFSFSPSPSHVIFSFSQCQSHVIFSLDLHTYFSLFSFVWLLLRYNSRSLSFSLQDSHERCFCVCGLVNMRACARGVNSVILLSANLYTRTWLTKASSGTYTAVHAV